MKSDFCPVICRNIVTRTIPVKEDYGVLVVKISTISTRLSHWLHICLKLKIIHNGASEKDQLVKTFATTPDNLSSISARPTWWKERTNTHKVSSDPNMDVVECAIVWIHPYPVIHTHLHNVFIYICSVDLLL